MPDNYDWDVPALLAENRQLKVENAEMRAALEGAKQALARGVADYTLLKQATTDLADRYGGHQLFICPRAEQLGDVFDALALDASVRDGDRIRCAGVGDLVRRFGIWTAEPVLSSPRTGNHGTTGRR